MILIAEIWRSFRALPLWVQIWVALILVPVNLASSFFIYENMGLLVALLAIGGMTPNPVIMMFDRGVSKAMAIPHLVIWFPLVVFLIWIVQSPYIEGQYQAYLWLLLVVDGVSLAFDIPDTWKWAKGDRAIAS
ncbi:hypothetical protein [Profundibacter sp.]